MRVYVPCPDCFDPGTPPLTFHIAELDDSGVAYVECPEGHKGAVVYDRRRYELLLRSAVGALLDGYASEATSVASGALERTYEFAVRVLCGHRGVDANLFGKAWKFVASQSERQLGAFCFLYLTEFSIAWSPPPSMAAFRNKVVHRGYLPRESEVLKYCESVYNLIKEIEGRLTALSVEAVDSEAERDLQLQESSIPQEMNRLRLKAQIAYVIPGTNKARLAENFQEFCGAVAHEMKGPGADNRREEQ